MNFRLIILFTLLMARHGYSERDARAGQTGTFELGKRHYETGHYARALDLFGQSINSASDGAERNRAYYFQGMVLFEMGHYYSAYISFRNVLLSADDKNREVYEKAIKNAVTITDRLGMVDRLGKILDKLPNGYIPSQVGDYANYAIGVFHFKSGNDSGAASHLKSVHPESPFFYKAMFHLGIISTKKKDYKEAVFYFQKVGEVLKGKREGYSQAELARLNMARSLYSSGNIERSIEVYSQFLSSSPHWLTVLLEASWPLMRVNDTTVSLGNLHTITSPFYREDLVGEAYLLRSTVLYSLCKYEEMRLTLAQFFSIYDPIIRSMQTETNSLGSAEGFYRAFVTGKGVNRAFINYAKRDEGLANNLKIIDFLRTERRAISRYSRNDQMKRMATIIDEADSNLQLEMGAILQRMHKRKLSELLEQREQANYLKVEIVTGEKELIEGQKGLPPKRVVDVETSVAAGYHFWPFTGEYWEDEMGTFVYTTESSCVN